MESPTEPEPIPPDFNEFDIRPTCVRLIHMHDTNCDRTSYDAEIYEGTNDSDFHHLTTFDKTNEYDNEISTTDLSSYMNIVQNQSTKDIFPLVETTNAIQSSKILRMRINVEDHQMDSGANKNVTNDRRIIRNFTCITPIPIFGVDNRDAACHIDGKGITELLTNDGSTMAIQMYYSKHCSGTIISPNAIVKQSKQFTSWIQTSHLDTGNADIMFFHRTDASKNKTLKMVLQNDLWFIHQSYYPLVSKAHKTSVCVLHDDSDDNHFIQVKKLHKSTEYELWHQRLMHPGITCMDNLHKCVTGVPHLKRNSLHSCKICNEMNIRKKHNKQNTDKVVTRFAERFQMDYGFMSAKIDNRIIRSHEGYNCYLLIIDYYTRYTWVFLSKNKAPPINTISQFLRTYGLTDGVRHVRTDQGGELARSAAFKATIQQAEYNIEITGADNSSQNGVAERPHQTLADMVRAGLENSGLPPKFWSDAILHAVYIKNRLPHQAFNFKYTPYERLTGTPPDLSKLRIFGSRVVCRKPGGRNPKLSKHSYSGIFLRFAKTMKNIVYLDLKTKQIKTSTFAKFDEAHFSYDNKPPGAKILIELGMQEVDKRISAPTSSRPPFEILRQDEDAIIPQKGSAQAAGYDLHSMAEYNIPPQNVALIDTGIAVKLPEGTYGRIASRSGLVLHHYITVMGGVIDPDYTGNLKVLLYNFGVQEFKVQKHDRIAQLILECYSNSPIKVIHNLNETSRGKNGFGSSGRKPITRSDTTKFKSTQEHEPTPKESTRVNTLHCNSATIDMIFTKPIFTTTVTITKTGSHPTLGLQLKNDERGPLIVHCLPGTPSAKVPRWRQILKNATIHSINDVIVHPTTDIAQVIQQTDSSAIEFHVLPPTPIDIHPDTGVPQVNFDQFLHIAAIHHHLRHPSSDCVLEQEQDNNTSITIQKLTKRALTRPQLMKQPDWEEWEQSEFTQLEQYKRQKMFGNPGPLPDTNITYSVLPMIWVYVIKTDGRKKARCVANGASHFKGTITLANTYAACLDQSACRLFWAIAAIKCKKVYGLDAVNAFAEAPPPVAPLYLKVDNVYKNWYMKTQNI